MYSSCSLLNVKSDVPLHASHQQILWFEISIMSAAQINLIFSVQGLFKSQTLSMSNSGARSGKSNFPQLYSKYPEQPFSRLPLRLFIRLYLFHEDK